MAEIKALVIADDFYHHGSVIKEGLAPIEKQKEIDFTYVEDTKLLDISTFKNYDLIFFAKGNARTATDDTPFLDEKTQQAVVDFVEAGGGLLAFHAACTVGNVEGGAFDRLIGCTFVHHPKQCEISFYPIADHEVTKGVTKVTGIDEHYFIDVHATDVTPLFETHSQHGYQSGGYVRTQGKGRVCVIIPTHNVEFFLQEGFQTAVLNGIHWCVNK